MAITDAYRRQHIELADLMQAITTKLDDKALANGGAKEARDLLSKLAGKLLVHLAAEDQALYPRMMASQNAEISTIADHFQKEMGGLKQAFERYYGAWNTVEAIRSDPAGFIDATGKVFEALGKRVDRENTYLYPLADRL